jgi:hypothetical protein
MTVVEHTIAAYKANRGHYLRVALAEGKWCVTDHDDTKFSDKPSKSFAMAHQAMGVAIETAKHFMWSNYSIAI